MSTTTKCNDLLLNMVLDIFSVPTSLTLVDFKMVNLHAFLRCVYVRPVKYEMTYQVTYGNVSRILRKSVNLGDSVTMSNLILMKCVNKRLELHTSFTYCDKVPSDFQPSLSPKSLLGLDLYEEGVYYL